MRPQGLRTRPWFRNLIYVADENNGYANMAFPSVNEAIRANDEALTTAEIEDLASAVRPRGAGAWPMREHALAESLTGARLVRAADRCGVRDACRSTRPATVRARRRRRATASDATTKTTFVIRRRAREPCSTTRAGWSAARRQIRA